MEDHLIDLATARSHGHLQRVGDDLGAHDGLNALADDVKAVVRAQALRDCTLIGHSMRGMVAQLVANRHPPASSDWCWSRPTGHVPTPRSRRRYSADWSAPPSALGVTEAVLTAHRLTMPRMEAVVADSLAGTPEAVAVWPNEGIVEDIVEDIDQVDRVAVPVSVIVGEMDVVEPPSPRRLNLLPHRPQARLSIVPDAGRLLPLEAPEAVSAAIVAMTSD